ncbi:hypothetical protein PAL_GLEAN10006855 [Pteropus alecto]|uniref:Uncharacterized protein n=1 Tax=Pteropus alecto TaxID=9402 RepID=L5L5P7_PTEAL|nr:hypothetical protein PAL_GLEAN10006855 [Pteropus alecto]
MAKNVNVEFTEHILVCYAFIPVNCCRRQIKFGSEGGDNGIMLKRSPVMEETPSFVFHEIGNAKVPILSRACHEKKERRWSQGFCRRTGCQTEAELALAGHASPVRRLLLQRERLSHEMKRCPNRGPILTLLPSLHRPRLGVGIYPESWTPSPSCPSSLPQPPGAMLYLPASGAASNIPEAANCKLSRSPRSLLVPSGLPAPAPLHLCTNRGNASLFLTLFTVLGAGKSDRFRAPCLFPLP